MLGYICFKFLNAIIIFSWFFLLSNLETVINLGFLFFKRFSTPFSIFLLISSIGLIPGLMILILFELTPQPMARSFVYFEFETTWSTLFKTFKILLFEKLPLSWLISLEWIKQIFFLSVLINSKLFQWSAIIPLICLFFLINSFTK